MKIRFYPILAFDNTTTAEKNIPIYLSATRDNCLMFVLQTLVAEFPFSFIVHWRHADAVLSH